MDNETKSRKPKVLKYEHFYGEGRTRWTNLNNGETFDQHWSEYSEEIKKEFFLYGIQQKGADFKVQMFSGPKGEAPLLGPDDRLTVIHELHENCMNGNWRLVSRSKSPSVKISDLAVKYKNASVSDRKTLRKVFGDSAKVMEEFQQVDNEVME